MEYEFKDLIEASIHTGADRYAIEQEDYEEYNDAIVELHRVYAQASKVDEYEAKAKAFDYILGKKNEVEDDIYKFAVVREESAHQYLGYEVFKFIDEYESGESDE